MSDRGGATERTTETLRAVEPPDTPAGPRQLDNPMWHALQGPQRRFALINGRAARYDPEVAPFAAIPHDPDPAVWGELAALFGPDEFTVLTGPREEPPTGPVFGPPEAWETIFRIPGVQMVGPSAPLRSEPEWVGLPLGADDIGEMLDLVERTKPGPFLRRTPELGGYLGIRRGGRLVAMAGHRMHLQGFTEISAVCTDVEVRGRGIAGALVDQVVAGIIDRGEQPFLHATVENVHAIRLYESLGFTIRTQVEFLAVRPPNA